MFFYSITAEELGALDGLPYIHQALYFRGIRPYMDRKTGIVGIKRRISYQSLREALYIEPGPGLTNSGSPSYDQLRRAVKQLINRGLLKLIPAKKQLIFECALALLDKSVQNKPASVTPYETAISSIRDRLDNTHHLDKIMREKTIENYQDPTTPHNNKDMCILYKKFEKFWDTYPQAQNKPQAWNEFQKINPDDILFTEILTSLEDQIAYYESLQLLGHWVPNWKYPANWLLMRCWEEELDQDKLLNAPPKKTDKKYTQKQPVDFFWKSCKGGADYDGGF